MATNYSVGHAMRRRIGIPSSSLEAAGKAMNRIHQTSQEAHEAAGAAGSHRIAIGDSDPMPSFDMSQVDELNPGQMRGTLMPKKSTQAMDPTAGGKANRTNIENIGASYRIAPKTTYVQLDPAAGPTMANARLVPSVSGRSNPNFKSGIESAAE
jgi:hypothetical protein